MTPNTTRPWRRILAILATIRLALGQSGCSVRCGPVHTVPSQRVHVITSSPNEYTVRIVTGQNEQADTPVPADGRVSFDVPVSSRYCTPYVFGVIKVGWPRPVEDRRVIRVMRGEKVIRKLSASDIARLATDAEGYGIAGRDYHQPAGMVAPALTLKRFVLEIGAR